MKFEVDKELEEMKLHNPFFGLTLLNKESKEDKNQKYFFDSEIEAQLGIPKGSVNKITSWFIVTFDTFSEEGKRTVDLGLNIKNYFKKCHVPGYVKYIPEDKEESKSDKQRQTW